jgi:hypothetical protein
MFEKLESRVKRAGEEAVERVAEELVEGIVEAAPGVAARVVEEGVELVGKGLKRRFFLSPLLRWIGGLIR